MCIEIAIETRPPNSYTYFYVHLLIFKNKERKENTGLKMQAKDYSFNTQTKWQITQTSTTLITLKNFAK